MICRLFCAAMLACCVATFSRSTWSEQAPPELQPSQDKTAAKPTDKSSEQNQAHENSKTKPAPKLPAQIELLETRVRFEVNGDSRKEVHARVHINDELGVRQFARLNFNYNRAFQSVEIPLAHITHTNGGTSDVLPSAIADNPDPAVVNFPAYQDVRVKSIRILGLAPGDIFEYRVVTTTTHHPLAPDFWFEHTFDRSGVTSHEIFELDLPADRTHVQVRPDMSEAKEQAADSDSSRRFYHWDVAAQNLPARSETNNDADVVLTTYSSWEQLAAQMNKIESLASGFGTLIYSDADARLNGNGGRNTLRSLYRMVAQGIKTVDLPLSSSFSVRRSPQQILDSGYGTAEEKARLLYVLATQIGAERHLILYARGANLETESPRPDLFSGALFVGTQNRRDSFLDPSLEVAPFGLVPSDLRGHRALKTLVPESEIAKPLVRIPDNLPFPSKQTVTVEASLARDGALNAKVKYVMRGDNELVLRLAFHQAPKDKWSEVAQLLAVTDGFRGKISKVIASDPFATQEPFAVQFEVEQPKLLDWTKAPLRIPAIIPLLGLPDAAMKLADGVPAAIQLGTPLDVEVSAAVHLPEGTGAEVPAGTSLQRDFATYESHYGISNGTLTASRHINFILKEIPADRAAEYNAFLHAVQNDESQLFTLQPPENLKGKPAASEQKQRPAPTQHAISEK